MCQIIGLSNIQGLTKDQISQLALTARDLMKSQKSGFGFAYSTTSRHKKQHAYYVEKYVSPSQFNGIGTVGRTKKHFEAIKDAVNVPMLSSGHPDAPTGPMIIHGRTATSSVNLTNTHPFRKKGWALVHNGVVDFDMEPDDFAPIPEDMQYAELLKSRYSTCDSEYLLNTYAFGKGHEDWNEYIEGYAATMTINPHNELIVAKDNKTNLYIAAIPKLNNTLVFSTVNGYAQILAESIGYKATEGFRMEGQKAVTVESNGTVYVDKFKEMYDTRISSSKVQKAIGYNPDTNQWYKNKQSNTYNRYDNKSNTVVKNHSTGEFDFANTH